MCQHFNCLPQAGGLLDQDARLVWILELVAAARADKAKADQAHKEAEMRARKATGGR